MLVRFFPVPPKTFLAQNAPANIPLLVLPLAGPDHLKACQQQARKQFESGPHLKRTAQDLPCSSFVTAAAVSPSGSPFPSERGYPRPLPLPKRRLLSTIVHCRQEGTNIWRHASRGLFAKSTYPHAPDPAHFQDHICVAENSSQGVFLFSSRDTRTAFRLQASIRTSRGSRKLTRTMAGCKWNAGTQMHLRPQAVVRK